MDSVTSEQKGNSSNIWWGHLETHPQPSDQAKSTVLPRIHITDSQYHVMGGERHLCALCPKIHIPG